MRVRACVWEKKEKSKKDGVEMVVYAFVFTPVSIHMRTCVCNASTIPQLRELRSLVIEEAAQYGDFPSLLRGCCGGLEASITDLRSQIVREACVTVA